MKDILTTQEIFDEMDSLLEDFFNEDGSHSKVAIKFLSSKWRREK